MNKTILTGILLIVFTSVFSQEILTGLSNNPVITQKYIEKQQMKNTQRSSTVYTWIPVELPFFTDFSSYIGYPDTALWLDDEAYVNDDFPYRSANLGAATLDVLDSRGFVYNNGSIFPFVADHLTSRPIRLDSIFEPFPKAVTTRDSVYFSFFYQPQGRAYEPPESNDSLVLEFGHYGTDSVFYFVDSITVSVGIYIGPNDTIFPGDTLYSPCDNNWPTPIFDTLYYTDNVTLPCDSVYYPEIEWTRIWSAPGMHIDTFYKTYGTYSKQVMIPILDSANYYRSDFFFRFFNYASLAEYPSLKSNCDEWNIDFIYLNMGRSQADTLYRSIGFVERSPSILRNYEAMPYDQYLANPTNVIKDTLRLLITNLSNTTFNTIYKYILQNESGSFEKTYDGGSCNLQPFYSNGYQNCQTCWQHACPPWKYLFPLDYSVDHAIFDINHILLGDFTSTDTIYDTLHYQQNFMNYFAYDDGTPEDGYGLIPAGAKAAVKFNLNRPDTLQAIQMFFNRTQNSGNDIYFDLVVWRDNNGVPGEEIYRQYNEKPKFSKNLFEIQTYKLDTIVPVNGVFYIGWKQSESIILNVGFDRYNDAREFTFYNSLGTWNQSQFTGSLMMRPVLGDEIISGISERPSSKNSLTLYPNPAKGDKLNIELSIESDVQQAKIHIYNSYGQLVRSLDFKNTINIGDLSAGLYLMYIEQNKINTPMSGKFIVTR